MSPEISIALIEREILIDFWQGRLAAAAIRMRNAETWEETAELMQNVTGPICARLRELEARRGNPEVDITLMPATADSPVWPAKNAPASPSAKTTGN